MVLIFILWKFLKLKKRKKKKKNVKNTNPAVSVRADARSWSYNKHILPREFRPETVYIAREAGE